MNTSMEVREPSREVPAYHWSKIIKVVYIEEGKKGFTLLGTFLPQGDTVQCQKGPSRPMVSLIKKMRACE